MEDIFHEFCFVSPPYAIYVNIHQFKHLHGNSKSNIWKHKNTKHGNLSIFYIIRKQ